MPLVDGDEYVAYERDPFGQVIEELRRHVPCPLTRLSRKSDADRADTHHPQAARRCVVKASCNRRG